MPKIRTVKPELFRHEALFAAEQDYQLLLRLGFIGLFTCCDREGRFRWQPRQLKLDIFPYDEIDMARVLDALAARGFIIKYQANDKLYGCIPSWKNHQCINHREIASTIPGLEEAKIIEVDFVSAEMPRVGDASASRASPVTHASVTGEARVDDPSMLGDEENLSETADKSCNNKGLSGYFSGKMALEVDASLTRTSPVEHASRANLGTPGGKGSGRELEVEREMEEEKEVELKPNYVAQARRREVFSGDVVKIFDHWKITLDHPRAVLDDNRQKLILQALKSGYSVQQLCDAITGCSKTPHNMGHNANHQRYDGLHIILRSADQIERFIHNCAHPPSPGNSLLQSNLQAAHAWLKSK